MIVTDRQKRILQILLENVDGISLAEVEKRLETSRRTLYRQAGNSIPVPIFESLFKKML